MDLQIIWQSFVHPFHNQPEEVVGLSGCTIPCSLDGAVVVVAVDVVGVVELELELGFLTLDKSWLNTTLSQTSCSRMTQMWAWCGVGAGSVFLTSATGEGKGSSRIVGECGMPVGSAGGVAEPSRVGADTVRLTLSSSKESSPISEVSPASRLWLIPDAEVFPLLRNRSRVKLMGSAAPDRLRANRSRFFFPGSWFMLELEPLEYKKYWTWHGYGLINATK